MNDTLPPQDTAPGYSPFLRGMAQVLSYVFHPLFVPLYGAWLLYRTHPFAFVGLDRSTKAQLFASLAADMLVLPLITVLLLKKLGFISSIYLRESKDRIIPYVACMLFYFWAFYSFKLQPLIPLFFTRFFLGCFLAVALAFLGNIFMKVSMHALGMGGLIGLLLLMLRDPGLPMALPLCAALLVCGLVLSSRLVLNAHQSQELYLGFLLGLVAQLLALWFL